MTPNQFADIFTNLVYLGVIAIFIAGIIGAVIKALENQWGPNNMSFNFQAIARNVPAILIVAGLFLIVMGYTFKDPGLIDYGKNLIGLGVVLQIIYLGLKYGPEIIKTLDR